jgi:hypothetical protein
MPNNNPFMPNNGVSAPQNTPMPGAPAGGAAPQGDFEVDLTNVQDNFTVPDGNYLVQCTDVEQSVSKGGNPMFIWTFQIVGGDYAGREFKSFTAITPAAMWKVAETVQALGVGQTGSVVKFKRTDVVGKQCGATIEMQEYNGQDRSSISKVMSLAELKESNS